MGERTRPAGRLRRWPAALLVVASAVACADGAPTATTGSPSAGPSLPAVLASPGDIDPALLAPLRGLGPCDVHPSEIAMTPVDGLVLPPGAVVTEQTTDGPLTTVRGYVPLTPVQVRVIYQRDPSLEIIQVEDEIRESETLVASAGVRLFVKAQAVCEQGSVFLAVVAPQAADASVPTPTGAPAP